MEASKGRRASWAWASMLQGRDLLLKSICWQVNSGTEAKFWEDKWIPYVLGTLCNAIDSTTKRWKMDDLRLYVTEVEVEAICSIPIALDHTPDSLI